MKLSQYVRAIEHQDDIALYNTINHAVLTLPRDAVSNGNLVAELDDDSLQVMRDSLFFAESDAAVESALPGQLINDKKLFISLELNLSCNLRCPYCYQAGTHDGQMISDHHLDMLAAYVRKVHETTHFEDLFLKVLGGEPTLVWSKFKKVYTDLLSFCQSAQIRFHLLVDTNGTRIDDLLTLEGYDSLLLTIPLSYRECHDSVRFDIHGKGTYDTILQNINILHEKKPDAKIVIRYNVDENNRDYFKAFLEDLRKKLVCKPLVSVNYTAELNDSRHFKNGMTYPDFIEWSSTQAIDALLAAEMPVTISPIISIEQCQFRSKYSLKLFSDGTVGNCAMSFFDHGRPSIDDLVSDFSDGNGFFQQKNEKSVTCDAECMHCPDIFLCGGTNKLPCIRALNPDMCKNKWFGIRLDAFIRKYLDSVEAGTNSLFVVFENGESYR